MDLRAPAPVRVRTCGNQVGRLPVEELGCQPPGIKLGSYNSVVCAAVPRIGSQLLISAFGAGQPRSTNLRISKPLIYAGGHPSMTFSTLSVVGGNGEHSITNRRVEVSAADARVGPDLDDDLPRGSSPLLQD